MLHRKLLVATASIFVFAHPDLAQTTTARHALILDVQTYGVDAPIKITSITLGSAPLKPGAPVPIDGHLLRDLAVTVENISNQAIVEAGLTVAGIPSDLSATKPATVQSFLGRYPAAALFRRDGSPITVPPSALKDPILVQPGDTVTFKFDSSTDTDQSQLNQVALTGGMLRIQPATVYFGNGARWNIGSYLFPGDAPGKWVPISADRFKSM